ncbi:MAG: HDIG domain-containing protein [Planctomycetes bacterium]|nr:HDIG domain-containing protein [Planctomycetota bacterium]
MDFTREQAWEILCEYTKSESLRKHGLGVEACMKHFAEKLGEDVEKWRITGLLHDFDYEQNPTIPNHPQKGVEILKDKGFPEDVLQAILGHAGLADRSTNLAKYLFAVDELTGFLFAVTYVRPSKSIQDVKVKSVKKKLKDKSFAAAVNRDDIRQGALELGIELDEIISECIEALKKEAEAVGLLGTPTN